MSYVRVEVEWHDSGLHVGDNDTTWLPIEGLDEYKTTTVMTTGYLILDGKDDVIVATSWDKEHGKVMGVQVILKKCIVRMTVLRARKESQ